MKEFKVNDYITLKLVNGKTTVYVDGKYYTQFKLLMVKKPPKKIDYSHISESESESYDDVAERLYKSLDPSKVPEIIKRSNEMPPEPEFVAHCVTLRKWAESDYNTNLLSTNIAIPLLEKLTTVGDPLAKKIFKQEIAKRFNNGNLSFILYFLKSGYIGYLTKPEEREAIFYKNNKKLRDLITKLLQGDNTSKTQAFFILIELTNRKDQGAKELLHKQIIKAFNLNDLESLDYFRDNYSFRHLSDEDKKSVYYENNEKIRNTIDRALEDEETSLNYGFRLLSNLFSVNDQSAREVFKKTVKRLLLTGKKSTIEEIVKKRPVYISHFFTYNEMMELKEDPRSSEQLIELLDYFLEDYNDIIGFKKEYIISKKELLEKLYIPPNFEIPNSDFFLGFFNKVIIKLPYGIQGTFFPIYNYNVKKIIINSHLFNSTPIEEKFKEFKLKYNLIYEFFVSKRVKMNVIVHLHEAYFLDSNMPSNEEIKEMFTSIRDDVRIQIEDITISVS